MDWGRHLSLHEAWCYSCNFEHHGCAKVLTFQGLAHLGLFAGIFRLFDSVRFLRAAICAKRFDVDLSHTDHRARLDKSRDWWSLAIS